MGERLWILFGEDIAAEGRQSRREFSGGDPSPENRWASTRGRADALGRLVHGGSAPDNRLRDYAVFGRRCPAVIIARRQSCIAG